MHYFDTSALVKLVFVEAESGALRRYMGSLDPAEFVTSMLGRTELLRAAARRRAVLMRTARAVVERILEIDVTEPLLERAGTLEPTGLRTLDAIHLATAVEFGEDLTAIVSYDKRMLDAAEYHGLRTVSPA